MVYLHAQKENEHSQRKKRWSIDVNCQIAKTVLKEKNKFCVTNDLKDTRTHTQSKTRKRKKKRKRKKRIRKRENKKRREQK